MAKSHLLHPTPHSPLPTPRGEWGVGSGRKPPHQRLHAFGIELGSGVFEQLPPCSVEGEGCAVGTGARHGIEGVRHGNDARGKGDVVATQAVGRAGAVHSFVMPPNDLSYREINAHQRSDDLLADDRVPHDFIVFVVGEPAALMEQSFRHADLADVVQLCPKADLPHFGRRQPQLLCHRFGHEAHPQGMACRIGILCLECVGEGFERTGKQILREIVRDLRATHRESCPIGLGPMP